MRPSESEIFERATKEISGQFAGDPLTELRILLSLVQRRESTLLRTIDLEALLARSPRVATNGGNRDELGGAVAGALRVVAEHEADHVAVLDRWRAALESAPDATNFAGRLEGWIVGHNITGRQPWVLAGWLMNASAQAGGLGERIAQAGFAEGCLYWLELEQVAAAGYSRILELLQLSDGERWAEPLGADLLQALDSRFSADATRMLAEERFHAALLQQVHSWLAPKDRWDSSLTLRGMAAAIHTLAGQHLVCHPVKDPSDANSVDEGETWISDAGMGRWFLQHGYDLRLLTPDKSG